MKILDIGCGKNKILGAPEDEVIGVDITMEGTKADVVYDLNRFPYPFKTNSFDVIHCSHTLEHLQNLANVMKELHRITKPGGKIIIIVPSWNNADTYRDHTHLHFFTLESFDHWDKNTMIGRELNHYTHGVSFLITKKVLRFHGIYKMLGIEAFANRFYKAYKAVCWIFPSLYI